MRCRSEVFSALLPLALAPPSSKGEDQEFQTRNPSRSEIDRFYPGASNGNQERGFEMSKKSCKREKEAEGEGGGGQTEVCAFPPPKPTSVAPVTFSPPRGGGLPLAPGRGALRAAAAPCARGPAGRRGARVWFQEAGRGRWAQFGQVFAKPSARPFALEVNRPQLQFWTRPCLPGVILT